MSIAAIIGIALGVGVIAADRFIYRIPDWLAVILFAAAVLLIIAGMIASRNAGLIK